MEFCKLAYLTCLIVFFLGIGSVAGDFVFEPMWQAEFELLQAERQQRLAIWQEQFEWRLLRSIGPSETQNFTQLAGGASVACKYGHCTVAFCWSITGEPARCLTANHVTNKGCPHGQPHPDDGRCNDGSEPVSCLDDEQPVVSFTLNNACHHGQILEQHLFEDILIFRTSSPVKHMTLLPTRHERPIIGYTNAEDGDVVWMVGMATGVAFGKVANANPDFIEVENFPAKPGDSGAAVCHGQDTTQCILVGMLVSGDERVSTAKLVPASVLLCYLVDIKPLPLIQRFKHEIEGLTQEKTTLTQENAALTQEKTTLREQRSNFKLSLAQVLKAIRNGSYTLAEDVLTDLLAQA